MANNWYVYQEDIHGVNGLLAHPSKELLIDYIVSEDFVEICMPDGILKSDIIKIEDLSQQFLSNKITHIQYAAELLKVIENNAGDITTMYIEDFESLCERNSDFGKMTVTYFYEINKLKPLDHISNELKDTFRDFLDNADGVWVG